MKELKERMPMTEATELLNQALKDIEHLKSDVRWRDIMIGLAFVSIAILATCI